MIPAQRFVIAPIPLDRDNFTSFLDITVHRLTKDQLNGAIDTAIHRGCRTVIANHNLHSLYLFHRDPVFRNFYKLADLVHADGMGIVMLSTLGGAPLRRVHRTTYVDWMPDLCAAAATNGWRLFYVGSRPGVAALGAAKLKEKWPGLQIETEHGYYDVVRTSPDNRRVLNRIREYQPHVLLVGMGMPRQESWIAENLSDLDCNVVLPAGAAMDYIAGAIATPPRWIGRIGLEWLFRLMTDPRRLALRYLIEPWYIAALVVSRVLAGALQRMGLGPSLPRL